MDKVCMLFSSIFKSSLHVCISLLINYELRSINFSLCKKYHQSCQKQLSFSSLRHQILLYLAPEHPFPFWMCQKDMHCYWFGLRKMDFTVKIQKCDEIPSCRKYLLLHLYARLRYSCASELSSSKVHLIAKRATSRLPPDLVTAQERRWWHLW